MKRLLLLLPFALAACDTQTVLPTAVAPSVASSLTPRLSVGNGPARYQTSSTTYDLTFFFTYTHEYVITTNPCNGDVTVTGALVHGDGVQPLTTETLTNVSFAGGIFSYHAHYDDPYYAAGPNSYDGAFPLAGGTYTGDLAGSNPSLTLVTTT